MQSRTAFSLLVISCLIAGLASFSAAAEKTCIDCHKKVISKRNVHPALSQFARMEQGCPSCHNEPHAKKKGELSLLASVPDLCFMCHDKTNFTKSQVHAPVAGGDCSSCHNPHASDIQPLLAQPLPYLCQTCHPDKTNGRHIMGGYGFGNDHPVQGRIDPSRKGAELGCTSCHSPHSADSKHLIVQGEPNRRSNLCLRCHSKITVRP